jgi:hypothetical protein
VWGLCDHLHAEHESEADSSNPALALVSALAVTLLCNTSKQSPVQRLAWGAHDHSNEHPEIGACLVVILAVAEGHNADTTRLEHPVDLSKHPLWLHDRTTQSILSSGEETKTGQLVECDNMHVTTCMPAPAA